MDSGRKREVRVCALDAAMPFDFEARAAEQRAKRSTQADASSALKVGIVGFGNFGQFLARRLVVNGHSVIATSRSDYSDAATEIGVQFFLDVDDFCEEHPDVVILATSILSLEKGALVVSSARLTPCIIVNTVVTGAHRVCMLFAL